MKWLLIVFIFSLDADGELENGMTVTKLYDSQAECDVMGKNFREISPIPEGSKSMSTCIPQSIFSE